MKRTLLALGAFLPLLGGCGSDGSTSTSDEAALKAKLDKPVGQPNAGPSARPKGANPKAPPAGPPPSGG